MNDVLRVHVVAHAISGWGLLRLLESGPGRITSAGLSTDPRAPEPSLERASLCLIDLDDFRGADVVGDLRRHTDTPVLVLTSDGPSPDRDRAVRSGARGLVDKRDAPEQLLLTAEAVCAGELCVDHATLARVVSALSARPAERTPAAPASAVDTLSAKDRQTIAALATHAGAPGKVLSELLGVTEHSLRNRLSSIYAKLEVANRVELFAYAHRHGLIDSAPGPQGASGPAKAGGAGRRGEDIG